MNFSYSLASWMVTGAVVPITRRTVAFPEEPKRDCDAAESWLRWEFQQHILREVSSSQSCADLDDNSFVLVLILNQNMPLRSPGMLLLLWSSGAY